MSDSLAQIHHWLFNKIKIVNSRENLIMQKFSDQADTVEIVREMVNQSIGAVSLNQELDQIIDHNNIHQWLQKQINLVESREAYVIKELINMMGHDIRGTIEETFKKDGFSYGKEAVTFSKGVTTAPELYQTLNDYYLNGMPCDQCDIVKQISPNIVIWEKEHWQQEQIWQRIGAQTSLMEELYLIWLKSFISGANCSFTLEFHKQNEMHVFTIKKLD